MRQLSALLLVLASSTLLQATPADPASLQLRIVEGEATVYPLGSRATHGITVQVTDDAGKPVEGAVVNFVLPETGPGGTFSNGSKADIVTTGTDGRAAVWGMQWNRAPGSFEVRITAVKGEARAGTVCSQILSSTPDPAIVRVSSGHKWLWIGLAVAGGAGGAVVMAGRAGGSSSAGSSAGVSISSLTIGAPGIALGKP